jgi:hypothetical protein
MWKRPSDSGYQRYREMRAHRRSSPATLHQADNALCLPAGLQIGSNPCHTCFATIGCYQRHAQSCRMRVILLSLVVNRDTARCVFPRWHCKETNGIRTSCAAMPPRCHVTCGDIRGSHTYPREPDRETPMPSIDSWCVDVHRNASGSVRGTTWIPVE